MYTCIQLAEIHEEFAHLLEREKDKKKNEVYTSAQYMYITVLFKLSIITTDLHTSIQSKYLTWKQKWSNNK